MANRERGEVDIEIEGTVYKLSVSLHAWALAQDALTKGDRIPNIELIGKRLSAGHMLTAVAVFWAALQRHHPEIETMEQATELMQLSDGKASKAVAEAIQRTEPDPSDLEELGASTNPPVAQVAQVVPQHKRGTGARSTTRHAVSA